MAIGHAGFNRCRRLDPFLDLGVLHNLSPLDNPPDFFNPQVFTPIIFLKRKIPAFARILLTIKVVTLDLSILIRS